jgi:hypothetical protein
MDTSFVQPKNQVPNFRTPLRNRLLLRLIIQGELRVDSFGHGDYSNPVIDLNPTPNLTLHP